MLELKEKILSDGEIIEPDILKVDSFILWSKEDIIGIN